MKLRWCYSIVCGKFSFNLFPKLSSTEYVASVNNSSMKHILFSYISPVILSSLKNLWLNQTKFTHMIAEHIIFNIKPPSPFSRTPIFLIQSTYKLVQISVHINLHCVYASCILAFSAYFKQTTYWQEHKKSELGLCGYWGIYTESSVWIASICSTFLILRIKRKWSMRCPTLN